MPVDISKLLIYSAAGFGMGVLLRDLKNMIANLLSEEEDVSSMDSSEEGVSYVYSIEGKKDSEPRLVIRTKVEKNKN